MQFDVILRVEIPDKEIELLAKSRSRKQFALDMAAFCNDLIFVERKYKLQSIKKVKQ